ncbi:hypothetical protein Egran_04698 [Elaphomyces granulatus]|uniref:Uncharacterized protein n=1 Tax=Elaphomyces granulatus TaxID=519963 RepID=A0A232LUM5_9EURO|nr:hypothetical protein Egran_04698 [Elaphomyces granulatus]
MSVYSDWAPSHLKRLCSAIDQIPDVNFEISQQPDAPEQSEVLQQSEVSELSSETTGLSQGIGGVDLGSSFTTLTEEDQLSDSQNVTLDAKPEGNKSKSTRKNLKKRKRS